MRAGESHGRLTGHTWESPGITSRTPRGGGGRAAGGTSCLNRFMRAKSFAKGPTNSLSPEELCYRFRLGVDLEFLVDSPQIGLDGRGAEVQFGGDFLDALASRDALQHLGLPLAQ